MLMYELAFKTYESASISFFSQHGCLYFEPALAYYVFMIITVDVFAYSIRFSKSISVLEAVTVNCKVGETFILP